MLDDTGFKIELMNPAIGCLLGFQYWGADEDNDYNTVKIHFLWVSLRWDWI